MSGTAASLDAFAQSVERDTGERGILSGEGVAAYALGGRTPALVARPGSHEAAARTLARAGEAGLAVFPWGGGTGSGAGYPPARYDLALSTERLSRAVEFLRDDLTAIVEAGMTVKALNGLTMPEGQTAGLDPPHPGTATVGGALLGERSGPMRVRYGRARDRFMRVRAALADGSSHTYGALVVKNVTGYDMIRLLAGSWGTLAVATELAVRLYKVPEALGARAAGFPAAEAAFGAARHLMATPLAPPWVEVFDAGRAAALKKWLQDIPLPGPWCLAAAFGDFEEGLKEQLLRFEEIAVKSGGVDLVRLGGENARRLGEALANPPETDDSGAETLAFRASGRLDQLPRFAAAAQRAAGTGGYRLAVAAHAGSGVLRCWLRREDGEGNAALAWRTFAVLSREGSDPGRGRAVHVRVESGAEAIDAANGAEGGVPLWGEDTLDPAALDLMIKVRREYDPKRILSPGRFVGRL